MKHSNLLVGAISSLVILVVFGSYAALSGFVNGAAFSELCVGFFSVGGIFFGANIISFMVSSRIFVAGKWMYVFSSFFSSALVIIYFLLVGGGERVGFGEVFVFFLILGFFYFVVLGLVRLALKKALRRTT